MAMTKHIQERMQQRCINETMLQIVQSFGTPSVNGERIILNNKSIQNLEKSIRDFLKQLETIRRRGGLTLVECEGDLLTVFANNSYRKNLKSANK